MCWWRVGLSEKWRYWITRKWILDVHFVATFYSCLSLLTSLMLAICSDADTAAGCWQAPKHKVHVWEGWIHKTRQAEPSADVSVPLQRHYDTIVHCKCCLAFKTGIQKCQSAWLNSVKGCCCPNSSSSTWVFRCSSLPLAWSASLCSSPAFVQAVTAQPSPDVAHTPLLSPFLPTFSGSTPLHGRRITTHRL